MQEATKEQLKIATMSEIKDRSVKKIIFKKIFPRWSRVG